MFSFWNYKTADWSLNNMFNLRITPILKLKLFRNKLKIRLGIMTDRSALYEIEKSILKNNITGFP